MMRAFLVVVLLIVCLGVQSQPASPHPSESSQKKVAQPAKQRGTEQAPIFVKSIATPDSEDDARHKYYEHHEKPLLDWWLTVSTVALAVFTFLLFCFTAALWWVTYRLSKDAKDTSIRQSREMQASLDIAGKSADAAKQGADAARMSVETAIAADQPRFTVSDMRFKTIDMNLDTALRVGSVVVVLTNHGRTGAEVTHESLTWRIDLALDPKPRYPMESVERIEFGKMVRQSETHSIEKELPLSDDMVEQIRTRKTILWVYGYIAYRDFLDRRWCKGFVGALDLVTNTFYPSSSPGGQFVQEGPAAYTYTTRDNALS